LSQAESSSTADSSISLEQGPIVGKEMDVVLVENENVWLDHYRLVIQGLNEKVAAIQKSRSYETQQHRITAKEKPEVKHDLHSKSRHEKVCITFLLQRCYSIQRVLAKRHPDDVAARIPNNQW
jgi:hypothetical protein